LAGRTVVKASAGRGAVRRRRRPSWPTPRVVHVFTKLLSQRSQGGERQARRNAQVPYPSGSQQSWGRTPLAIRKVVKANGGRGAVHRRRRPSWPTPRVVHVFTKLLSQRSQGGERQARRNAQVPCLRCFWRKGRTLPQLGSIALANIVKCGGHEGRTERHLRGRLGARGSRRESAKSFPVAAS
jgi:hypothetical protein